MPTDTPIRRVRGSTDRATRPAASIAAATNSSIDPGDHSTSGLATTTYSISGPESARTRLGTAVADIATGTHQSHRREVSFRPVQGTVDGAIIGMMTCGSAVVASARLRRNVVR